MKKKFRQITVDGDGSWAWGVETGDSYYGGRGLIIWKDKQRVYGKTIQHNDWGIHKRYQMTPGLISRFIKIYLK